MNSSPGFVLIAVSFLLIATVALVIPVQGVSIETTPATHAKQSTSDVTASFVVHPMMDSPHTMRVEAQFVVGPTVSHFPVRIYNSTQFGYATTVESTSGFSISESGNYILLEYDGETTNPSVNYTVRKGPAGIGKGNPQPMIAGEDWVVFSYNGVTKLNYPQDLSVSSRVQVRTDLPVTHGNTGALVGERTLYNRSGKQDLTLVVPEAADMAADPALVLDLLDTTARLFPGDTPGERSYFFVLPEDAVGEQPTAVAISPDAFVAARSQINQAGHRNGRAAQSVWAHEMTHVQHMFSATKPPKMRWISEGHSDYVAAYASYMQGIISFDRFYNWTQYGYPGEEDRLHDDVISKPSTHDGATLYSKGRRVTLALDAKIRQDTGGNRTVFDVFYLLDQTDDGVSLPEFKAAVEQVAGRSYDAWIDKYVTTSAAPTAPRNESLFDSMPDAEVEKAEFVPPSQRVPDNLSVSVTYRIEPLPDRPTAIRVSATIVSDQLSWVTVVLPDRTDVRAELLSTIGIQPERGDDAILLVPAPERTEVQAEFILRSEEGFPPVADVDDPATFLHGISSRPNGIEVDQMVVVAGEGSGEDGDVTRTPRPSPGNGDPGTDMDDSGSDGRSSDSLTRSDGQPGFTAALAGLTGLIVAIGCRLWRHG